MSEWININDRLPSEKEDNLDHIHCWCAIISRVHSGYFVKHLAWNTFHQCWDDEDEDDVSKHDSLVKYWQPFTEPKPPQQ